MDRKEDPSLSAAIPSAAASRKRKHAPKHQTTGGKKVDDSNQQPLQSVKRKKRKRRGRQGKRQKVEHEESSNSVIDSSVVEASQILVWDSPNDLIPIEQEQAMVEVMFHRNGKKERGMLKDKPSHVLKSFRKAMQKDAPSMALPQVASLRRHHVKFRNQQRNMGELQLGKHFHINQSAGLFEHAVEEFLIKQRVQYLTEKEQRERNAKSGIKLTPDFLLKKPLILKKTRQAKKDDPLEILEERTIHWIEVKMFYGASTIPHGTKGAVGTISAKTQQYVHHFGPGAIVFMMGCGDGLAAHLGAMGVSVLDCSSKYIQISLDAVHDHQRTWCANEHGEILP